MKICGITRPQDAAAAVEAGADAIGFIFAASPRRVSLEQAGAISAEVGAAALKIGVFVDELLDNVIGTVKEVGLDGVQLHGDEDPAFVEDLRTQLESITIFKVVRSAAAAHELATLSLRIDAIFVDPKDGHDPMTPVDRIPVESLRGLPGRFIVAGGLNPHNVGRLVSDIRPWGVDVSAGVEAALGRKDADKIRSFVDAVRAAGGPN